MLRCWIFDSFVYFVFECILSTNTRMHGINIKQIKRFNEIVCIFLLHVWILSVVFTFSTLALTKLVQSIRWNLAYNMFLNVFFSSFNFNSKTKIHNVDVWTLKLYFVFCSIFLFLLEIQLKLHNSICNLRMKSTKNE